MACISPSMITRSFRGMPERMTRRPPRRSPISTGLGGTVPSGGTVMTIWWGWSSMTAAAGDQPPDRNEMRTDAAGEGCGDAGIFEVELGIADPGLGVIDRGLGGGLLGGALVDILGRPEIAALQRLGAAELGAGELDARG